MTTTNTNMPTTESSVVYEEIEDMLQSTYVLILVSYLETRYREKYERSLDCNSIGFNSVEDLLEKMRCEGMVLLFEHPKNSKIYVTYARTKSSKIQEEIVDMLVSSSYEEEGISVSCLETRYREKYKRSLDCNSIGFKSVEELLEKMRCGGMVRLFEHNSTTYVRYARTKSSMIDMPTESSDVYKEIVDMLVSSLDGWISVSCLEKRYSEKYKRSLNCNSLGFNTIEELLENMRWWGMVRFFEHPQNNETYVTCPRFRKIQDKGGRVLVYEDPESKEKRVMCVQIQKARGFLKHDVLELLSKNRGKIRLSDFESKYLEEFKEELKYHYYGLTGPDNLCQELNLVLEEEAAGSQGEKVIKPSKILGLRKRKILVR